MKINALIPVKSLSDAKSRLAQEYSFYERKELVFSMLNHILTVLKSCNDIKEITLVTPDELIKKYVLKLGVNVLPEEKHGLNQTLTFAAQKETKTLGLLTIFADLPFLKKNDIEQMINYARNYEVVLASSKDNGTNAILLKKPLLLPYLFGNNSFKKYFEEAKKAKLKTTVYTSKTIAFDIDTVEDVKLLNNTQLTEYTF